MYKNDNTNALAVFSTIIPTTTFIIGYWFAKRSGERQDPEMPEGMQQLQTVPLPEDEGLAGPESTVRYNPP